MAEKVYWTGAFGNPSSTTTTTTTSTTSTTTTTTSTTSTTDGDALATFMALLFFYNAMFTNWKDCSTGKSGGQYDSTVEIEGENNPFATGMAWKEIKTAILKYGNILLPTDLVTIVEKSKNMDDLQQMIKEARTKAIDAMEKPDWSNPDFEKVQKANANCMKKFASINEKFEKFKERCMDASNSSTSEANPIMNGDEWNTLWTNFNDIWNVMDGLMFNKMFEKSIIFHFFESMVSLVWTVPMGNAYVSDYGEHLLARMKKEKVKPPSARYYEYQNLFDMYGVMKWFHEVKMKCNGENGEVTMRAWFTHFVNEMKQLKQEFTVDMNEIMKLFTPSNGSVEIGCASNLYEEDEWNGFLAKNTSFSIASCMTYIFNDVETFEKVLQQETEETQDVKDMFDALYKLFRRGILNKKKLKFTKCSGKEGLADEALKCCVEVYGTPVTGTNSSTVSMDTNVHDLTGEPNEKTVTRKKKSGKRKNVDNEVDKKTKRPRTKKKKAKDKEKAGTPFRVILSDGAYVQEEARGTVKKKNGLILSLTVTLDPKTGKKIVYRDAQGGLSAVPNLIPPNQDSSYQRYTGYLVNDGIEMRLEEEESMYIREEDNSSDEDDEDDEDEDEEEEYNPYDVDVDGAYIWNGQRCDFEAYYKQDSEGDVMTDTICHTKTDLMSDVTEEDLFDKVPWGKDTLPWIGQFQRTETMMRYRCRGGDKDVYVEKEYENEKFEAFDAKGSQLNVALFDDGGMLVTEDNCALYKVGNLPKGFDESKYKKESDATYDFSWYDLVDGDGPSYIVVRV